MKRFFFTGICFFLLTVLRAQVKVSLHYKEESLHTILEDLLFRYQLTFFWSDDYAKHAQPVSIDADNIPIKKALSMIFSRQPFLTFSLDGNYIDVQPRDLYGVITNEEREKLPGVTVRGIKHTVVSDSAGRFFIEKGAFDTVLHFSHVNMEPLTFRHNGVFTELYVMLKTKSVYMQEAVTTGYRDLEKVNATGSYAVMDRLAIERRAATPLISRMEGSLSGLLVTRNANKYPNQPLFSIRGGSTIAANPHPLLVFDDLPYTGDHTYIHLLDIESIIAFKDAAATALYGPASGNGVVVMNNKKGKYGEPMRFGVFTGFTWSASPDLDDLPQLSAPDFIKAEQLLFSLGAYDELLASRYKLVSPVVETLDSNRRGLLSNTEKDARLAAYAKQDAGKDIRRILYQPALLSQSHFSVSGGSDRIAYYFSIGWDAGRDSRVGSQRNRLTINGRVSCRANKWLELTGMANMAFANTVQGRSLFTNGTPYTKVVDGAGNALAVPAIVRNSYKDSVRDIFPDWAYKPLEDVDLRTITLRASSIRASFTANIHPVKSKLTAQIKLAIHQETGILRDLYDGKAFYARALYNTFTEIQPGGMVHHVPAGGILDYRTSNVAAQTGRVQLRYRNTWNKLSVSLLGGAEMRVISTDTTAVRFYGVHDGAPGSAVDEQTPRPISYNPIQYGLIPGGHDQLTTFHCNISWYLDVECSFNKRFVLSASSRWDQSNLFGMNANRSGIPLWSTGIAWNMDYERWYRFPLFPYCKLRANFGYNGNVDYSVTPYATSSAGFHNQYGSPARVLVTPSNPDLRWEKAGIWSFGADLGTSKGRWTFSLEYYIRRSSDLIAERFVSRTTGFTSYKGNYAKLSGHGADISIKGDGNLGKKTLFGCHFLFGYHSNRVTHYEETSQLTSAQRIKKGYPVTSLFSFAWAGLDYTNGDPVGYAGNVPSKNYYAILYSTNDNLIFSGSYVPRFTASFQPAVRISRLELSLLFTARLGHVFRRSTISYSDIQNLNSWGHPDFKKRWERPGDELKSDVPSLRYPFNPYRETFYLFSQVLMEKADNIRMQDVRLDYIVIEGKAKGSVKSLSLFVYINNPGILWKSTDAMEDPDYLGDMSPPLSITAGLKAEL